MDPSTTIGVMSSSSWELIVHPPNEIRVNDDQQGFGLSSPSRSFWDESLKEYQTQDEGEDDILQRSASRLAEGQEVVMLEVSEVEKFRKQAEHMMSLGRRHLEERVSRTTPSE